MPPKKKTFRSLIWSEKNDVCMDKINEIFQVIFNGQRFFSNPFLIGTKKQRKIIPYIIISSNIYNYCLDSVICLEWNEEPARMTKKLYILFFIN